MTVGFDSDQFNMLMGILRDIYNKMPDPPSPQRIPYNAPAPAISANMTVDAPAPSKAGPPSIYPDPALTPGVPNPQVTQENIKETIGTVGWTATIRPPVSTTSIIKAHIMQRDNLPGPANLYELDHFISLELGGHPSDLGNLWCQPYAAAIPNGGAHQKDAVETALKVMIVGGLITLEEGQRRITTDWYAEYLRLHSMGMLPMMVSFDPDGSTDPDDDA